MLLRHTFREGQVQAPREIVVIDPDLRGLADGMDDATAEAPALRYLFEPEQTGEHDRSKMSGLLNALKALGDLQGSTDVERFVLPGVAQLSD